MFGTKFLASFLLVLVVLFGQVGSAAAASQTQDPTPLTGTIQSIAIETDANGVTTVLVTLLDDQGTTQTVRLSLETATGLNLVDPSTLGVSESQIGQPVTIDPTTVIPDEEPVEEPVHPIAALLASFFGEDPGVVNDYHEDGFGFGVIAQALWMSRNLTITEDSSGDASLAQDILEAKRDKDFEAFFEAHPEYLGEGETIPTNWGQFKKKVSEKKNNLGVIVSGQEDADESTEALGQQDHGNGKEKNKDKGKGKDKNKNKP